MTTEHDQGVAADLATDLADELMPRVREAAERTADHATFWRMFLAYWLGAAHADLGPVAARRVAAHVFGPPSPSAFDTLPDDYEAPHG